MLQRLVLHHTGDSSPPVSGKNSPANWLLSLKLSLLSLATLQTLTFCYSLSCLVPLQKGLSCPYLHHLIDPFWEITNTFPKGPWSTELLLYSHDTLCWHYSLVPCLLIFCKSPISTESDSKWFLNFLPNRIHFPPLLQTSPLIPFLLLVTWSLR